MSSYVLGYDDAHTRSHAARTVDKDAAFLLPFIKPDFKILDVGCGPGSITMGFATLVPAGSVIGIDISETVIEQAKEGASAYTSALGHVSFQTANVLEGLPFEDQTFDVVFAHQVLIHLPDPVRALKEMKRVTKKGGMVACREADISRLTLYPDPTGSLAKWNRGLVDSMAASGASKLGGVELHVWARKAGFELDRIVRSTSTTTYYKPEERSWWAGLHQSDWRRGRVHRGKIICELASSEDELAKMCDAMRVWSEDEDGFMFYIQFQVICTV